MFGVAAGAMSAAKPSLDEAYAILGLKRGAAPAEATAAFRAAAKQAHPDRPGGDAERFRQILAAYRLVQSVSRLPATIEAPVWPEVAAIVSIDPLTALRGGEAQVRLSGERVVHVRIQAGAREGDRLAFQGAVYVVRIVSGPDAQVRGSDVWVTASIAASALAEGGRVRVETPLGAKVLWITPRSAERRLVRLEGQGLPAAQDRTAGSLYIRLAPETGAPMSPARAQLRRFAAAWAA